MAVYKRTYRSYSGNYTPERLRFLVITRQAWVDLFVSRMISRFFMGCLIPILVSLILIYLSHNQTIVSLMRLQGGKLAYAIDAAFFKQFLSTQIGLAILMTAFAGPGLISPDLANNALALYFSRPLSRREYILGKFVVLAGLISLMSWVPGLLLFAVESSMSGLDWLWTNLYIAQAMIAGSLVSISVLSLLALSMSAWVKWKPVAGSLILGVIFLGAGFGAAINSVLRTDLGQLLSIPVLFDRIWDGLFRLPSESSVSALQALSVLAALGVACVALIARKLRAYEVV